MPPIANMKNVMMAVPIPRRRYGTTAWIDGWIIANADPRNVRLIAPTTMKASRAAWIDAVPRGPNAKTRRLSKRFGIAYWSGTSTVAGSSSRPRIRRARSGLQRKVASNRRPTQGRKPMSRTPAGATANPRSSASSPNSSSRKKLWIDWAGKRANPIAAMANVMERIVSIRQIRAKAASTEMATSSWASSPPPRTSCFSHWPRSGSGMKNAAIASAATGMPRMKYAQRHPAAPPAMAAIPPTRIGDAAWVMRPTPALRAYIRPRVAIG